MQSIMNIISLCVILIVCLFGMYGSALKSQSGPYETRLISCRKCVKPKPPYHKDAENIHVELYNTSTKTNLVRGNGSLTYTYRGLMGKAKKYSWVNGKWKPGFYLSSDHCNGFLGILFNVISLDYDVEHCLLRPGQYQIKDVDANTLQHTVMSTYAYGRVQWKIVISTKTGTLFCYDFETLVVPA